ncbi:DUF6596 domain-containing protein [Chitinophaga sp. 212800010-3]|uniref:RNA polymerase sigma factor n=1 Tax=unclassified Chitinophaga TaxID=2619133 RepID=UPI002DE3015A|nr:DUF6596 domain-containing protein [Chitinophaga sp. 212800010-3]
MQHQELIPRLFRTEFRKITAVLCKTFGLDKLGMAEDIASETFLAAMETWPYKGIPEQPVAWLYLVAKNKAKNYLQRQHLFDGKIAAQVKSNGADEAAITIDWSDQYINDSQLQMLFAVCHPAISKEAQVGLALRILCGFGITEIANAFLTNKETINKRLFRAREKLREEQVQMEMPGSAGINTRLDAVLTTLYLLFNEGYYSESDDVVLREDLCLEAIRLTHLLTENPSTNLPAVNALLSLMCFHASRFPARKDSSGEIILYADQDERLWNEELISRGAWYLHQASQGNQLSRYHLEAMIAWWNTQKQDTPEKWAQILQLYNQLLQLIYSPVAALNRTYALARVYGPETGIREAEKLKLEQNHYYFVLLGELYTSVDTAKAAEHFQKALALAQTQADKQTIQRKLDVL